MPNAILSENTDRKTAADRKAKTLQFQAAEAFKTGSFAQMLELDRQAQERRRANQTAFFNEGMKAFAPSPIITQAQPSARRSTADGKRVFKVARTR